ncbi:MAG: 30S ribosomal protein S11 [bacterium]
MAPRVKKEKKDKKKDRKIGIACIYIQSTFNNTIVTIASSEGNVVCWASAGSVGFKGTKKGTPFAAQIAADTAAKKAFEYGVKDAIIFVTGPGAGRESAVRAIQAAGMNIKTIRDVTPIPHNGCRARKRRRV